MSGNMPKFTPYYDNDGNVTGHAFECPGCGQIHLVDKRWTFNGDTENPTITPSLLVRYNYKDVAKRCHSFIKEGKIQFLNDCTHELAGKTVDLPQLDWHYSLKNFTIKNDGKAT